MIKNNIHNEIVAQSLFWLEYMKDFLCFYCFVHIHLQLISTMNRIWNKIEMVACFNSIRRIIWMKIISFCGLIVWMILKGFNDLFILFHGGWDIYHFQKYYTFWRISFVLNNIQQLHEIYSVVYLKVFKSNKSTCDDNSLNGQFVKQ